MHETPDPTPQPYGPRFCRAAGLLAVGMAMHLSLPSRTVLLLPHIAPQQFVLVHPAAAAQSLFVERTTVFAPRLVELEAESATGYAGFTQASLESGAVGPASELSGDLPAVLELDAAVPVGTSGSAAPAPAAGRTDASSPEPSEAVRVMEADYPALRDVPAPVVMPAVLRATDLPARDAGERLELSSAPPRTASEEELVRRLLDDYAVAFERLDVHAAKAVWPSVDGKALKRAFEQLSAQRVTLQSCGITISGSTANARCQGSATYHPKIGTRAVQVAREWTFDLSKKDAAWRIVNTFVR